MEARKLDYETQATIIPFKKEIDMTLANIANAKSEHIAKKKELLEMEIEMEKELIARNNAARNYSAGCKRNKRNNIVDIEDVWCFLSALSMCGLLISMYFLGCIL
jgi:hypothetical protein